MELSGREAPAAMAAYKAASVFRGLAVAGGGESSESEDDGWEIGYLDRASQVAGEAVSSPRRGLPPRPWKTGPPREPSSFLTCFPFLLRFSSGNRGFGVGEKPAACWSSFLTVLSIAGASLGCPRGSSSHGLGPAITRAPFEVI